MLPLPIDLNRGDGIEASVDAIDRDLDNDNLAASEVLTDEAMDGLEFI